MHAHLHVYAVCAVGLVDVWSYIASPCAKGNVKNVRVLYIVYIMVVLYECIYIMVVLYECSEVQVLQTYALHWWKSQSTSLRAVKGGYSTWDPFTTWHSSQLN